MEGFQDSNTWKSRIFPFLVANSKVIGFLFLSLFSGERGEMSRLIVLLLFVKSINKNSFRSYENAIWHEYATV